MNDQHVQPPHGTPRPTPTFHRPEKMAQPDALSVAPAGDARPVTNFLPDLTPYTLTICEAIDRFATAGRNRPSLRTMQRYCQSGEIDCYKLSTTRSGTPIAEWLVSDASLARFIERRPPSGVATERHGDTSSASRAAHAPTLHPHVMATPKTSGDASDDRAHVHAVETPGDDMATPTLRGDAKTETRTLADVLIENARLTAELAGRDAVLLEIKDERAFLRETLQDARTHQGDVRGIAERMLETLETLAMGGKLNRLQEAPRGQGDNRPAQSTAHDVE